MECDFLQVRVIVSQLYYVYLHPAILLKKKLRHKNSKFSFSVLIRKFFRSFILYFELIVLNN